MTRSGGLGGARLTTEVDSAELPDAEARRLEEMAAGIDLGDLANRSPLRGSGADRFQYDLVVTDRSARHEITVSEDAASSELRTLIDWLLARARGAADDQR
ncbi:MAG: protealysin inhibitor emfourin [Microbacterium sp.]|uniref:protealysin inhibitor emfourin n=1 Tax=Microbacterium sp. TaxID=51671 RepID=UPI003D6E743A